MKRKSMVQWINLHQNYNFVNRMRLPLLCETFGAIPLMLVQAVRQKLVDSKKFRFSTDHFLRRNGISIV